VWQGAFLPMTSCRKTNTVKLLGVRKKNAQVTRAPPPRAPVAGNDCFSLANYNDCPRWWWWWELK